MSRQQDVTCVRVRLKPDMLARVREWAAFVSTHRQEALQTLKAEGVEIESVFLESSVEGDSLIYYMRASSQREAERIATRSLAAIDAYHHRFKQDAWEKVEPLELLLDLRS
ncbi:DUF6176 family protein [Pseudomonas mangrovi]|uniref:NIPSNAP domain-containing protein n=1 Tax=Pseudomonas mangrovi TaxID=2161748 RepID=A0A2T5PDZ6_9PSED|nr:DUF6176 family protein [Pseudomonas mangrovi]PTU75966.1 hypothetical protein DBO85_02480 [Pseudomonas mangrovi]